MRDTVFRQALVTIGIMEGRVAAMMATRPGWLDHLYVHPAFQRRGLGEALIKAAKRSDHARTDDVLA